MDYTLDAGPAPERRWPSRCRPRLCGQRFGQVGGSAHPTDETGADLSGAHALDARDEPHPLQQADREAGEVELPPAQAVEGAAREGVMVVVPAFAQRQQADQPLIAAAVPRAEGAAAEGMANRVHAPGHVMRE